MTAESLQQNDVMNWFGIPVNSGAENNPLPSENESEWVENMHIGLTENDKEKKEDLVKFGRVLENIRTVFIMLSKVLAKQLNEVEYAQLTRDAQASYKNSKEFCYAAKVKKIKSAANYETTSYTHCLADFMLEGYNNMNKEYPALNRKNAVKIKSEEPVPFILREKKGQQALKYLQFLIKQLNNSSSKIDFLLSKENLIKQNDLAKKLCSINVKQDIRPSKSFCLTEETRLEIWYHINDNILYEIQEDPVIDSQNVFYHLRKHMITLDTAVRILELCIENDALETLKVFRAYKNEQIFEKLEKMGQKEKTKEIRESKKAFLECEKVILDREHAISSLLSEIGTLKIEDWYMYLVNTDDSDSIYDSFDGTVR